MYGLAKVFKVMLTMMSPILASFALMALALNAHASTTQDTALQGNTHQAIAQSYYDVDARCGFQCMEERLKGDLNPLPLSGTEFVMRGHNSERAAATLTFKNKEDFILETVCGTFSGKYETRNRQDESTILNLAWQDSTSVINSPQGDMTSNLAKTVIRTVMANCEVAIKNFQLQLTSQWGDMANLTLVN